MFIFQEMIEEFFVQNNMFIYSVRLIEGLRKMCLHYRDQPRQQNLTANTEWVMSHSLQNWYTDSTQGTNYSGCIVCSFPPDFTTPGCSKKHFTAKCCSSLSLEDFEDFSQVPYGESYHQILCCVLHLWCVTKSFNKQLWEVKVGQHCVAQHRLITKCII